MKGDNKKKEEKREEVREALVCSNCGSAYIYVLVSGEKVCRKCGYKNGKKE